MHAESILFSLGNETLEEVKECNYLVQIISAEPNHEREIWRRIGIGWEALGKHSRIMQSKLPLSYKRNLYNRCALPVMTYRAETWRFTKQTKSKVRSAQRVMERIMVGVALEDRKRTF